MLLLPEALAILVLDILFLLFGAIAFYLSFNIYRFWDINQTTVLQYGLEKRLYLANTIIKFIFSIKLPLFLFFIFTLDKISNVIKGAMCAAGVVDATVYGLYLLALKIVNIYLFVFWLKLNYLDINHQHLPYTRKKSLLFISIFFLLVAEIVLDFLFFDAINIDKIVSCCGNIYSSSASSLISSAFKIEPFYLYIIFYGFYALMILFYILRSREFYATINLLFIPISLVAIITLFSPYIYELPTHHCPFCLMQSDYYFVGYFIYSVGFLGTSYGLMVAFFEDFQSSFKKSLIFNSLYVILLSSYILFYYLKNGVFL